MPRTPTSGGHNGRGKRWIDEGLEWLVIDISEAFWLIPLLPQERKFFVFKFRGRYFAYLRTPQEFCGAQPTGG